MKTKLYNKVVIYIAFITISLISCNQVTPPVEPPVTPSDSSSVIQFVTPNEEMVANIMQKLSNGLSKEWAMLYQIDSLKYVSGNDTLVMQGQKREYKLNNVPLWMFNSDATLQSGKGSSSGMPNYKSGLTYSIKMDKNETYYLHISSDTGENLYEIISMDSDSMHLKTQNIDDYDAMDLEMIVLGRTINKAIYIKDYFWYAYNYSQISDKSTRFAEHIIGKWLLEQSNTVLDYHNGYTSPQGLTHTDSTIVYTTQKPYLKVVDSTNYEVGVYANGDITYLPSPEDNGYKKGRTYYFNVNEDGEVEAFFKYFYVHPKQPSGYTMTDAKYIIDEITDDYLIMHRNLFSSVTKPVDGVMMNVRVYSGVSTEKWTRLK